MSDHVRAESSCDRLKVIDDDHEPPVRGAGCCLTRVDESTFDDFQNHAAQSMEALHSTLAFLHSLERGAGRALDLGARGPHIVGEYHHVVDSDDGQRCLHWRSTGFERHRIITMLDAESRHA